MKKKENEVRISPRTGKPMKKPRGGNSPLIGMNGYNLQPGDNAKIAEISIKLLNLPNIDLTDVNQVAERLSEYFRIYAEADMKPTVAGLAIALNGHSRQWLHAVVSDTPIGGRGNMANLRPDTTDLIKKTYAMMENQWESYMNSGKLNPVTGIFLAKNNFHYRDQTEHILTPNTNNDADIDPEAIKARYMVGDGKDD